MGWMEKVGRIETTGEEVRDLSMGTRGGRGGRGRDEGRGDRKNDVAMSGRGSVKRKPLQRVSIRHVQIKGVCDTRNMVYALQPASVLRVANQGQIKIHRDVTQIVRRSCPSV